MRRLLLAAAEQQHYQMLLAALPSAATCVALQGLKSQAAMLGSTAAPSHELLQAAVNAWLQTAGPFKAAGTAKPCTCNFKCICHRSCGRGRAHVTAWGGVFTQNQQRSKGA